MSRAFFCGFALVMAFLALGHGAEGVAAPDDVDAMVSLYNQNLYDGKVMESTFTAPASDIATKVNDYNWFANLVFIPFLILPQVLLIYAMLKFRDRGDGRKPATFMHHTKLENAWTAIPILTLFIVGIPAWPLLYEMDTPRAADHKITVRGKSFAWDYEYKDERIAFGQDAAGLQEPMVIAEGKVVSLAITSNDVNHAWWVPAFGVKKDAINGRYNHCWFTPTRQGFFKGQCAELCGSGHGIMVISALVVSEPEYQRWVMLQTHRNDTLKVFNALKVEAAQYKTDAVAEAVKAYFEKGRSADRALALRYWIASNFTSMSYNPPKVFGMPADQAQVERARHQALMDAVPARRKQADELIRGAFALGDTVQPVIAAQEK